MKIQKKNFLGGVGGVGAGGGGQGGRGGSRVWGQGGCEWRSKVFMKIQKKKKFRGGGGSGGSDQGLE